MFRSIRFSIFAIAVSSLISAPAGARRLQPSVVREVALTLNADRFADFATMFERRGYRFIPLERWVADHARP